MTNEASDIHGALWEVLQRIASEYGIQVHGLTAHWVNVSPVDQQTNLLRTITIESVVVANPRKHL